MPAAASAISSYSDGAELQTCESFAVTEGCNGEPTASVGRGEHAMMVVSPTNTSKEMTVGLVSDRALDAAEASSDVAVVPDSFDVKRDLASVFGDTRAAQRGSDGKDDFEGEIVIGPFKRSSPPRCGSSISGLQDLGYPLHASDARRHSSPSEGGKLSQSDGLSTNYPMGQDTHLESISNVQKASEVTPRVRSKMVRRKGHGINYIYAPVRRERRVTVGQDEHIERYQLPARRPTAGMIPNGTEPPLAMWPPFYSTLR